MSGYNPVFDGLRSAGEAVLRTIPALVDGPRTKMNAGQVILLAILGPRLIAGAILVGFTRPEFAPLCIARTSLQPVEIVVITFDFLITGVIVIRAGSMGMLKDIRDLCSNIRGQSKGVILTIVGFIVWTTVSHEDKLKKPKELIINSDKCSHDTRHAHRHPSC